MGTWRYWCNICKIPLMSAEVVGHQEVLIAVRLWYIKTYSLSGMSGPTK